MALKTLQQLTTMVRRRLGWPTADTVVSDAELRDMLQGSMRDLHEFLISTYGSEYSVSTQTIATSSGVDSYAVPNTSRVHRVSVRFEGRSVPFRRRQIQSDAVDHTAVAWAEGTDFSYRLVRTNDGAGNLSALMYVHPVPNASYVIRVVHTEPAPSLSLTGDVNTIGHDEYLILDVAAKLRLMEEQDASEFTSKLEQWKARVVSDAPEMDMGQPQFINDARSTYGGREWP